MKKLGRFLTLCLMVFPFANATISTAYDYDRYYSDYLDEKTYYIHKEYKTGTLSDENSCFNGCDIYTVETVEAHESLPTLLEAKYDYILAPSDVIGNWFEYRSGSDKRFSHKYDVKLPLHKRYVLNEETLELEEGVSYEINVMWKNVPYISVTADTDSAPLFDNDQLKQMFPEIKSISIGKDSDGNYISYMSTGNTFTNFSEFESDVDTVISLEDAQKIAGLRNEHVLDISYCSSYETQRISLSEYPTYPSDYVESAVDVFEAHGYNVTIENNETIIPDENIPSLEYFEIISEIQMKEGIMPEMVVYETDDPVVVNSIGLFNKTKGDINGDGSVEISDIVLLQKYLLGGESISLSADLNEDGSIDVYDMVLMRKMLVGEI